MKNVFLVIILFSSTVGSVFAAPDWYQQRMLVIEQNELIGYGEGKTQHKAKLRATQDIAFQLGVDIEATISKNIRSSNEKTRILFTEDIRQKSRQKLSNLDIVKSERDGNWYVAVKAPAIPYWFSARLFKAGPDLTVGYGSAATIRQAQITAAKEIALQLGLKIRVDSTLSTRVKNDKLSKTFSEDIKISSEHELGEIRLLNSQNIKGTWYVAAEIGDDRHFSQKLVDKLRQTAMACHSESKSYYLNSLASFKSMKRELGCMPSIKLYRRNNYWQLTSLGVSQNLTDAEYKEFLAPLSTPGLKINADKTTVYEDDAYTLQISSEKDGYLSCFIVYEDGHVALLFTNERVRANQNIEFPSRESGLELVAELPKRGIKTTDLYIVVRTDQLQQFSEFEEMTDTIQRADDEIKFGKLIQQINSQYASVLIHTLPLSRKIR